MYIPFALSTGDLALQPLQLKPMRMRAPGDRLLKPCTSRLCVQMGPFTLRPCRHTKLCEFDGKRQKARKNDGSEIDTRQAKNAE